VARAARLKGFRAPGRVNLIGEHTDYNSGFVLPIAIGLGCRAKTTALRAKELRVTSAQMDFGVTVPLERLAELQPTRTWADYPLGVARELARAGYDVPAVNLVVDATVPTGSGLSSSAALEVASALALLGGREMPKLELARLCQRAERDFAGMPCGIMDQYASLFGEAGQAILIDCRDLTHRLVPLPGAVSIAAVNTMVKHELGSSAYRRRVAECAEALTYFPGKDSLRDVTLGELERTAPRMPEVPLARARHVILECWRVLAFLEAAAGGDLERMGRLFVESHRSLQRDYEVSCEELDFLVDSALTLDGVYGARMTGGGFGGCTVNLVAAGSEDRFEREITRRYQAQYGLAPAVYRCTPAAGAGPL
jgi:galactokinase